MTRMFTFFLLIGWVTTATAQKSALLVGKWVFKEALNKGIDKAGKATLENEVIGKMTFHFKNDGSFTGAAFGQTMVGKWLLLKDAKSLLLNSSGEQLTFSVMALTKEKLILKIGLGEFLMTRI